jgi:hypothetical protein
VLGGDNTTRPRRQGIFVFLTFSKANEDKKTQQYDRYYGRTHYLFAIGITNNCTYAQTPVSDFLTLHTLLSMWNLQV